MVDDNALVKGPSFLDYKDMILLLPRTDPYAIFAIELLH